MSDPETPAADHPTKTAYLKEAMRLVELGIEEQRISKTVIERKAVLLIMFCTAVIGYLATAEFYLPQIYGVYETVGKIIFLLKIFSIISLAGAAVCSIGILKLARFTARGSNPEAVLNPYFGHSYDKFAEYYLSISKERFQRSVDIIEKKADKLEVAYYLLMAGLTVSFTIVLTHQIARGVSSW